MAKRIVDGPVKFFVAQPHRPKGEAEDVVSHLVGIRKDAQYPMYVMDLLHDTFSKRVYGNGRRSADWGPITDPRYAKKYPNYDVFWLCRADKLPDEYVIGVLRALFSAPVGKAEEFKVDAIDFEYELG
jgi:hypothetical protein